MQPPPIHDKFNNSAFMAYKGYCSRHSHRYGLSEVQLEEVPEAPRIQEMDRQFPLVFSSAEISIVMGLPWSHPPEGCMWVAWPHSDRTLVVALIASHRLNGMCCNIRKDFDTPDRIPLVVVYSGATMGG
jgi:hypothetical protein